LRFQGKSRLGFYLLPMSEALRIRRFLVFPDSSPAMDSCVGDGAAFEAITSRCSTGFLRHFDHPGRMRQPARHELSGHSRAHAQFGFCQSGVLREWTWTAPIPTTSGSNGWPRAWQPAWPRCSASQMSVDPAGSFRVGKPAHRCAGRGAIGVVNLIGT